MSETVGQVGEQNVGLCSSSSVSERPEVGRDGEGLAACHGIIVNLLTSSRGPIDRLFSDMTALGTTTTMTKRAGDQLKKWTFFQPLNSSAIAQRH